MYAEVRLGREFAMYSLRPQMFVVLEYKNELKGNKHLGTEGVLGFVNIRYK
jgi:hypothetical protein